MKLILSACCMLSGALLASGGDTNVFDHSKYPARLKRADSFLGIHFDFHASDDCKEIGKNTTPEMINAIIDQVKPDYIQIDCKGHRGLSSYPTKVGHPAPGFVGDPLRTWREVTAKRGVALFMHYSGVWDTEAIARHPDWARLGPDGKPDGKNTSVFGPYVDKLLIPQLKELRGVYGVDGVWIDGECWSVDRDYSPAAIKAFQEATGIMEAPKKAGDPGWWEFSEFNREAFRKYVRHYVSELHKFDPDFQIASNWLFSEHMPETVTVDVDYLSGDFSPVNSYRTARFSARCLAPQGMPWDLMAWAFGGGHADPVRSFKTVPQLQQEAAAVLAQGGGFQAYFSQERDGSIKDWTMKLMAGAARFCRERQELCHQSQAVPQVALLYSKECFYRQTGALFIPYTQGIISLKGVLNGLLDSQYSVDIRSEHHLRGRMKDYPLIVVPQVDYLDPAFKDELVSYAKQGGNLLLVGPSAAKLFAAEAPVEFADQAAQVSPAFLESHGWLGGLNTAWRRVKDAKSSRVFGAVYESNDFKSRSWPAATIHACGKGRIGVVWLGLGEVYDTRRVAVVREFLANVAREMFPRPMVEVEGSRYVDVSLRQKAGRLLVNLVNTSGPHADNAVITFGEVEPVGPLNITMRPSTKPKRVTVEPGGQKMKWSWKSGEAKLILPRLDLHQVVVVE